MQLIAIDPGLKTSNTGVAVFRDRKLVYNGIYRVQDVPWRDNMSMLVRFLRAFKRKGGIWVVEKSYYPGKANVMHLKTLGVLDYYFGIDVIAPTSVKKIVTGSGKSTKQEVKNSVIKTLTKPEIYKLLVDDEDAVDAVAIGLAYMKKEDL